MPARLAQPTVVAVVVGVVLLGIVCAVVPVGNPLLAAALFAVQVLLAAAWLAFVGSPARLVGLAIAAGSALAADLLLTRDDHDVAGALAGVVALSLVTVVFAQLFAREHRNVTQIFAAHISAVLVVCATACVIALRGTSQGRDAALLCLAVLVGGSVSARFVSLSFPGAVSAGGGIIEILAWALVGGALGAAILGVEGLLIGLLTGVAAALADLFVNVADLQARGSLLPVLLPLSSAAPVSYLLSRVLLG